MNCHTKTGHWLIRDNFSFFLVIWHVSVTQTNSDIGSWPNPKQILNPNDNPYSNPNDPNHSDPNPNLTQIMTDDFWLINKSCMRNFCGWHFIICQRAIDTRTIIVIASRSTELGSPITITEAHTTHVWQGPLLGLAFGSDFLANIDFVFSAIIAYQPLILPCLSVNSNWLTSFVSQLPGTEVVDAAPDEILWIQQSLWAASFIHDSARQDPWSGREPPLVDWVAKVGCCTLFPALRTVPPCVTFPSHRLQLGNLACWFVDEGG